MEPSKDSPSESLTLGSKRKRPEFGSSTISKMARTNGRMLFCSCQHGCCKCCFGRSAEDPNHLNFLRSMTPRRIMFYSTGEWSDFPESVTSLLVKAFRDKTSAVKIPISGSCYLFDFLSMVLINLENGGQRSVSWIDESDNCFFPNSFFDGDSFPVSRLNIKNITVMDVKVPASATDSAGTRDQSEAGDAPSVAPYGSGFCEVDVVKTKIMEEAIRENRASPVSVNQTSSVDTLCSELVKLERHSRDFIEVARTFLSGLCNFAHSTSVMGIYRYTPKNSSALARQENFKQQVMSTRCRRGNANMRCGWFGTSSEQVFKILLHGFTSGTEVSEGAAHGTGVYLMPENCSFASVKYCDVDENGAQCVVLCQIVMGNMEKVPAGSKQSSPSNLEFDSGVDDLLQPNCYVIWGAHTTTHIHPEYIVSFKLSPTVREYLAGLKDVKVNDNTMKRDLENVPINYPASRPRSPWMSLTLLFAEIKDKVSPLAMELLNLHHREYKNKMISREELVKKMRLIVGDPVMISTLKRLQQNPSSFPSQPVNDKSCRGWNQM
uniref:Inactive poly [ADP-ribose] polymerase RCD1 n=1 Tax=Anthurium amnicola TaxID=1678845 RepID=A0A1D1ZEY1_9ARAE